MHQTPKVRNFLNVWGGERKEVQHRTQTACRKRPNTRKEAKPNKIELPPLLSSPAIAAGEEETKREKKLFFFGWRFGMIAAAAAWLPLPWPWGGGGGGGIGGG